MRTISVALLSSVALACSVRPFVEDGDGGGGAAGTTSGSSGGGMEPTSPAGDDPVLTTSPGTMGVDSGSEVDGTESGAVFLLEPDGGGNSHVECNLYEQDCARGHKCVPVSIRSQWDGSACVPVVDEPRGLGEACTLEDPVTGVDDCGFDQFCWRTDESGMGECIGLCLEDDSCEDPNAVPTTCQSCFCICVPTCDPLAQDCDEGQACYPTLDHWQCAPDASGGVGQDGACEFINACAAGTACLDAGVVPSCTRGASSCCTAVCDISLPETCPGQELGMACQRWYQEGTAPPGLENVGVCALPP